MAKRKTLARLRHKVILCKEEDVVVDGSLHLRRKPKDEMWASIEERKVNMYSPGGLAMMVSNNTFTHVITARHRPDILVSSAAWLYEERLISAPRWFKIMGVKQTEGNGSPMSIFHCRLVERGDDILEPDDDNEFGKAYGMPDSVKL